MIRNLGETNVVTKMDNSYHSSEVVLSGHFILQHFADRTENETVHSKAVSHSSPRVSIAALLAH